MHMAKFRPCELHTFACCICKKIMEITITRTTPDEAESLQRIARQTFFETFAVYNTEENMKRHLEEGFSLEKINQELIHPETRFYLARHGDQVIGYLKLNFGEAQTELKDANALEIERIYVLKDFHGKRAGQMLYEKAIEIARQAQVPYVWLGVWERNARAIRFYEKNGFTAFSTHIFMLGDDRQTDIMMKLWL